MKKIYLLLILALPMRVLAQPTIHNCDNYNVGDLLIYVNCNTGSADPGSGGASQTWDLSSLTTAPPGSDTLKQSFTANLGGASTSIIDHESPGSFAFPDMIYMNVDSGQ